MKTVYLAGSINGLTYEEATGWRKEATEKLQAAGFLVRDPMRGKKFLEYVEVINDQNTDIKADEIFFRDVTDILTSHYVLINLDSLGNNPMIGTLFELGYGFGSGKDLFMFNIPEEFKLHPFLLCAGNQSGNLNQAIHEIINHEKNHRYHWTY